MNGIYLLHLFKIFKLNTIKSILVKLKSDLHLWDLLKGSGIFLISKVFGILGIYLFYIYISKVYGAEGNGVLSFVLTVAVLASFVVNLGLNTYLVKLIPDLKSKEKAEDIDVFVKSSLWVILLLSLIFLGGTFGMESLLDDNVVNREWISELQYSALLCFPLAVVLYLASYYKTEGQFVLFSVLQNNWIQILAFLFLLIPVWSRQSPLDIIQAVVVSAFAFALYGWIKLPSNGFISNISLSRIGRDFKYFFPMLVGGLGFVLFSMTDRLMLRFLVDIEELGIYAVALRISNLSLLGLLSFNAIAESKYAELYAQGNNQVLKSFVQRSTWIGIAVSLPIIVVLLIIPDFFLGMFGHGQAFLSGKMVIYLLCLANLITAFCGANLVLLNMTGNQKIVQNIILFTVVLNIGLNYSLIPIYGIDGAAGATSISTIVWNLIAIFFIRTKLGFFTIGWIKTDFLKKEKL